MMDLNKNHLILAALLWFGVLIGCGYPDRKVIDRAMLNFHSEESMESRARILGRLLGRMNNPDKKWKDDNLNYLLSRLIPDFRKSQDEAILIAMDSTRIDAGFAQTICGSFYFPLRKETGFINRYRENVQARKALTRCWFSLSEEDFPEIFGKE